MSFWKKAFKWNRILHRDIGFLCVGLTVIYAISGIAVNHMEDWNPNYDVKVINSHMPLELNSNMSSEQQSTLIKKIFSLKGRFKSSYEEEAGLTKHFYKNAVATVNFNSQKILIEKTLPRPILYEVNFLHLNSGKKFWTGIADVYAFFLFYLALSGLFMVKGQKGALGRGAWLVAAGFIIPILSLFFL